MNKISPEMRDYVLDFLFKNYMDPKFNPITNIKMTISFDGQIRLEMEGFDSEIWNNSARKQIGKY